MIGGSGDGEFRRGWTVVLAAAVGVGLGITGLPIYTLGQFILPLNQAFGWSRAAVAGGLTCLTAVSVVAAPVVGFLIDRFGARPVALFGLLGSALGYAGLTLHAGSIVGYYAGWMILALLGAGTSPNVWTRVVATWFDRNRGLALGLTLCGTGAVAIVGPTAIGAIIAYCGWQHGFLALAAVQIVVALPMTLLFFQAREAVEPSSTAAASIRPAESPVCDDAGLPQARRQFWQIIVAFFLIAVVVAGMIVHLPSIMADFGVPRTQVSEALALLGVSVIVGRLGIGALMDWLPARVVAPVFILLPVGSCLLLLDRSDIRLAVLLCGLATGAEVDLLAYLVSRYFDLRRYARIYGWALSAFSAGAGLGPVLAGWARDTSGSYAAALYSFIVFMIVGAGLIGGLGPVRARSDPRPP